MPGENMEIPKKERNIPKAPRDLIPLPPNELVDDEQLLYGNEWRQSAKLVGHLRKNVEKSKRESVPEDYAIASSVCRLLKATIVNDRIALFHQEFDGIIEQSETDHWEIESLNHHLRVLKMAYLMGDEEFTQEMTRKRLAQLPMVSIPGVRFRLEKENKTSVKLFKFSAIHVSLNEQVVSVEMKPVFDGGIDSVAYPISSVQFTASGEKPIDLNLTIIFSGNHKFHHEFSKHPELLLFMKNEFLRVTDIYRESQGEPIHLRSSNGDEKAPFRLERPLLKFLEDNYLKKKLSKKQYRDFKKALNYADSDNIKAVVGLKSMAEQLVDEKSFLRKGFFLKKHPNTLQMVVEKAHAALESLGCQIEGGDISNFFQIVDRAARDSSYANKLNKTWDGIFRGGDKTAVRMMKMEVKKWASIYQYYIYLGVFQKALEAARGVVIIDGTFFSNDRN